MRWLAVLALACGCWRDPPPASPIAPPPQTGTLRPRSPNRSPCDRAIDHVFEIVQTELESIFGANTALARSVAIQSCQDTHWSDDVVRCFEDLESADELGRCRDMITAEQLADVVRRLDEVHRP